jgi:hypothetical protein
MILVTQSGVTIYTRGWMAARKWTRPAASGNAAGRAGFAGCPPYGLTGVFMSVVISAAVRTRE